MSCVKIVLLISLLLNVAQSTTESKLAWVWREAKFTNVNIESWRSHLFYSQDSKIKFTHGLNIWALKIRNTPMNKEDIFKRYQHLALVFSQCNIKILNVDFIEADLPFGWVGIDGYDRQVALDLAHLLPKRASHQAIIIYILTGGDGAIAYAWPAFEVNAKNPLLDTIWVSGELGETERNKRVRSTDASTEAHELGHVLGNYGHVLTGEENFLSVGDKFKDKITPIQCAKMKAHHFILPLKK